MESRRLRAGMVLVLAVIALGAAGAAVDSTGGGGGSPGVGDGSESGLGSGASGVVSPASDTNPLFPGGIIATIIGLLAVGGIVAAVVAVVLALLDGDLERLLKQLYFAAVNVGIIGLALLGLYLLMQILDAFSGGGSTGTFGGGSGGASEAATDTGVSIPAFVGLGIVVAVLIAFLFVARSADDEEESATEQVAPESEEATTQTSGPTPSVDGVGRIPPNNDVYRAWLSLARTADADIRRSTPGEVADRAVEAGVDESTAREITTLFESVRYGGREPTEDLERRAERARTALGGGT